ncbi:hypothetical protein yc1106_00881 [Curvularia clavata]|uniref:Bacteriophage T5 Orf172 DNA-binding domain-containing protein n=1 Tax=Curvularia clavata TaxID=95742 RepID=A0A9Q8Z0T3_CURCL|nr:hypothetical protein yc1106_00881 [Curvularia clavata]
MSLSAVRLYKVTNDDYNDPSVLFLEGFAVNQSQDPTMSPSTFHMPSTKSFPGHYRSSPSSAEPASNRPLTTGARRLVTRPRVPGRGTKSTRIEIPSKDGHLTNESASESNHTAGSRQAQSSPDVFQEGVPLSPSDPEETSGTQDAPQPKQPNSGGYSSSFTPYTTSSTQNTLWDVMVPVVSSNAQRSGKIYVYRDPNSEDSVYKVGTTIRPLDERMGEHKRCCSFEPKVLHESGRDINNSVRLEELIKWAFSDQRMLRPCPKRIGGHNEWFAADKENIIETVKKLEDFMDHEQPYDAQGNLSIIWRYLLRNRSPNANGVRKLCAQTRNPQWAAIFASPTYKEYAYAYLSHAGSELGRFRGWKPESYWQLSTVVYSLWTLALSRNVVAFYALIIVLACAGNTLLPKSASQSLKSKKRRASLAKKDTPNNA